MSTLAELKALAAAAAQTSENMNEEQVGGGVSIPAGTYLARLVEYVDIGAHPDEFEGVYKGEASRFRLGFALYNVPGTTEPVVYRPFDFKYSRNAKAGAFKLFKRMNYKGTAKTFAELVDETYLITMVSETKNGKTRVIMDQGSIGPAVDPLTKAFYPVPAYPDDKYIMFIWDAPTKGMWDKLFIEGTNDAGKSKNFIQDKILSASNFCGSAVEGILIQSGAQFSVPVKDEPVQHELALPAPAVPAPVLAAPVLAAPVTPAPAVPVLNFAPPPAA